MLRKLINNFVYMTRHTRLLTLHPVREVSAFLPLKFLLDLYLLKPTISIEVFVYLMYAV